MADHAYDANWPELSNWIKFGRAAGQCEHVEGDARCDARHGHLHPRTGSMVVLTTAHLDQDPSNNDAGNLAALCQLHHNQVDARYRGRNSREAGRRRKRRRQKAQKHRHDVIDNSSLQTKIALRRRLLEALPPQPIVLELCAGPGLMRRECYADLEVVAVDIDYSSPGAIHCDSRDFLRARNVDLSRFSLYDIDTHGAPWEWLWLLSLRCPPRDGRIGIVITNGSAGTAYRTHSSDILPRQIQDAIRGDAAQLRHYCSPDGAETFGHRLVASWFRGWEIQRGWSSWNGTRTTCYQAWTLVGKSR